MTLMINWRTYEIWQIRDFNFKWHQRVTNFILENYYLRHDLYDAIKPTPSKQSSSIYTPSMNERDYRLFVEHLLRGECCLAVVQQDTEEIKGVLLLKWMTNKWHSWTELRLANQHPKLKEVITLQHKLVKLDANDDEDSMHLFDYCLLEPLHNNDEFKTILFDVICDVAQHMKMPYVTFVAMTADQKADISTFGHFQEVRSVLYSLYENREKCQPFSAYRAMNELEAVVFVHSVVPITPYLEMPGYEELQNKLEVAKITQK